MNSMINVKNFGIVIALAACAACGSDLQLSNPTNNPSQSSGLGGATTDGNTRVGNSNALFGNGGGNGNTLTGNGNVSAGNGNSVAAELKCREGEVNGGYIAYCTCSTDGGKTCPVYNDGASNGNSAANPNAVASPNDANSVASNGNVTGTSGTHAFTCTTQAVTGGDIYTCNCGATYDPGDNGPACPTFFNPADANAQAPTGSPNTTCQTQATATGFTTTCTCTDGLTTSPCSFYEGPSIVTAAAAYQEQCSSVLTATGVTTTCTCDSSQQTHGATCPATFDPAAGGVYSAD